MPKNTEKLVLKRSYKKGSFVFEDRFTTKEFAHIQHDEWAVKQVEMMEEGIVEKDGKEYCYHTIRVLLEAKDAA